MMIFVWTIAAFIYLSCGVGLAVATARHQTMKGARLKWSGYLGYLAVVLFWPSIVVVGVLEGLNKHNEGRVL